MSVGGLSRDATRFLLAGLVNTGLTVLVYQLLLFALSPALAYAGAWCIGLVFVALVYPDRVFEGGRRDARSRMAVAASYAGVFLSGLVVLALLERAGLSPRLAILGVIVWTTLLNFALSRMILRR